MKITIYTTNTCAYCHMVEKYLKYKKLKYTLVNMDEHPERRQEAVNVSNGALTVPITVFEQDGHKHAVVGYHIQALARAVNGRA